RHTTERPAPRDRPLREPVLRQAPAHRLTARFRRPNGLDPADDLAGPFVVVPPANKHPSALSAGTGRPRCSAGRRWAGDREEAGKMRQGIALLVPIAIGLALVGVGIGYHV